MSLNFKVIPICYQNATRYDDKTADFLLEKDNWNDFGFRTTYHLHASRKLTSDKTKYLGIINVMKIGQTVTDVNVLPDSFTNLPDDFISISFSLDLFYGLIRILETKSKRKEFVSSINLLFDKNHQKYAELENDECFNKSILRNATMDSFVLKKGKQLFSEEAAFYDLEKHNLLIKYHNSDDIVQLNFGLPSESSLVEIAPYGIIAFIGHNGCGKSSFLYDLAKLLYMPPNERSFLNKIISVEPMDVGITKLLMFSYSAFDNFKFPGSSISELRLMAEGVENREGRFIYCGIRDVRSEINNFIENYTSIDEDKKINGLALEDRQDKIFLKPIQSLAQEFNKAWEKLFSETNVFNRWRELGNRCKTLLPHVYEHIKIFFDLSIDIPESFDVIYLKLSTGEKFFLHTMAHIFAYTEDNSILLFDEPENHLHPPMLSFMISEIRREIRQTHSVMLIATHSPVILQEMFANNVYIVTRDNNSLSFKHPNTETYGENFGYINNLVFNLNSDITTYQQVFDELFKEWDCMSMETIDDVIECFQKRLNCNSLSSQMCAYLVNKYCSEKVE